MPYGTIKVDNITFTNGGSDSTITVSGIVEAISGNITATGTIQGATIIGTSTVSGATVTGSTASFTSGTFVSGIFTTQISGATITGNTGNFTTFNAGTANLTSGVFASGIEEAPSLSIGTTTNGLYSPGADQVAISTGGSGRLFIGANPHVGVGITPNASSASSQVLEVGPSTFSSINNDCYQGANWFYTGAAYVYKNSAAASQYIQGGGEHIWTTASSGTAGNAITFSERLRITSAGLVGVGTGSPYSRFTVIPGTTPTSVANANQITIGEASQDSKYRLQLGYFVDGTYKGSIQAYDFNNPAQLILNGAGGNVGIGTSSPEDRLDLGSGYLRFKEAIGGTGTYGAIRAFNTLVNTTPATSIRFIRDVANVGNDGAICFDTVNSERLRIDSSGRVGIGTTSPNATLVVSASSTAGMEVTPGAASASSGTLIEHYNRNTAAYTQVRTIALEHVFSYSSGDAARIDSSGRLLVGTSSSRSDLVGLSPQIQLEGATQSATSLSLTRNEATNAGPALLLAKSRGTTVGAVTVVQSGDILGGVYFMGADGTNIEIGAQITGEVDATPGNNDLPSRLVFSTTADGASSPTERMRIDSSGRVGIGTTPDSSLHVVGTSGTGLRIGYTNNTNYFDANTQIFRSNNATTNYGQWDSSGRLLVGTSTSPSSGNGQYARFVVQSNTLGAAGYISLQRNQSATLPLTNTSELGHINFGDNAGNSFASIQAFADADTANNDYPGRLVFSTTADGESSPSERLRIGNGGRVFVGTNVSDDPGVGNTSTGIQFFNGYGAFSRPSGTPLFVSRNTDDGTLISLRQDGTEEGSVSVSGTTISYNGAHLSRWSQLPGGAVREEIMRGSVLSNIDEMCEWGDEDNEQLNRMKVSDIEGDKNVSGVFQAWDDDDDTYTNDFYCAMTGDFIIRIGAGVTVERGDLLMSAGDGTAKPQDDDIIRSKTIAKVTSTNVSCTYPDGSYCVPCVLMAC